MWSRRRARVVAARHLDGVVALESWAAAKAAGVAAPRGAGRRGGGGWAEGLRRLLSDPEMAALIAAVPRMGRILRPLCFMLKVETSLLRPAPPAPPPIIDGADADQVVAATAPGTARMPSIAVPGVPAGAGLCDMGPVGELFRVA